MAMDFTPFFRKDLPPPAVRWSGFPPYNFTGGHNDPEGIPVDALLAALAGVLAREGRTLATYNLESGPQGYRPLREWIATMLGRRAGIACDADQLLVTSGSLQALDLVNAVLVEPGDTVLVEAATYGGSISRLARCGAGWVGIGGDDEGLRTDELANALKALAGRGVRPKYLYTIPTVQNPTGTVMSRARRLELLRIADEYDVPVFEDDCYADLLWDGERPPALRALDESGRVFYCGSFSKSVAPAVRVGYVLADWPLMSRLLAAKHDGGTGALEQMVLAEFAAAHYDAHVTLLQGVLKAKRDAMVSALREHFGAQAQLSIPRGGIFIWVTLPDGVDTTRLAQAAAAEGVAINPGAEWTAEPERGRRSLRLCFGNPSVATIRKGVERLAAVCRREFPAAVQAPLPPIPA
jgi:2-aminoadipate transaminase